MSSRKILIIDDDHGVTDTFSRMLRLEGYEVQTASDPEAGLRECARSRPDAIIVDLRMLTSQNMDDLFGMFLGFTNTIVRRQDLEPLFAESV